MHGILVINLLKPGTTKIKGYLPLLLQFCCLCKGWTLLHCAKT